MSLATNVSSLATRVGTEFKAIRTTLGSLSSLNTTDKTSFVAAINEVKAAATGAPPDATEATKGVVELATTTEATTGTDTLRAVTPAGVKAAITAAAPAAASESAAGLVELATVTEATTGTDTTRAVTAAGVAAVRASLKAEILGGASAAYDTLQELQAMFAAEDATTDAAVASLTTAVGNRVRVDAAQSFTAPQQAQGRANIDAASATDMGSPTTDFVAVFNAALV